MNAAERKALKHIRKHGDDRNLRAKKWKSVKLSLYARGLLQRRTGDWAWIPKEQR